MSPVAVTGCRTFLKLSSTFNRKLGGSLVSCQFYGASGSDSDSGNNVCLCYFYSGREEEMLFSRSECVDCDR